MSDALATLRSAIAPKGGMQRIPFPLESYQHPSVPLSAKHLVNLYAEPVPKDSRSQAALISTPGLLLNQTIGAGPIYAMNSDLPGRIYVASGGNFYRISAPLGVVTDLGPIGLPVLDSAGVDSQMTTIAVGATAVVVCVPPNAWTADHDSPLNPIGGDFPGATSVTFLDGYYVFTGTGDNAEFFISRLLDPSVFDALDFAFSDALPNVLRRVVSHRGELWMVGEGGIEVWYDSGDADFPFRRRAGGVIPYGATTPKSIARGDGSVWWIGTDNNVYRSSGYQATRVSTHAVEAIIGPFASGIDCALTYTQTGHCFYVVTFVGQRTLAYDCGTQQWADRSSGADGTGRWRPNAVTSGTLPLLFGDSISGKIFTAVPGLDADDGVPVLRYFVMPPIWGGTSRAFCGRLEVEMEVGTPASLEDVTLTWSDDGGLNYNGGPRTLKAGTSGQTRKRMYTTRLGSFHQRVFKLSVPGTATFYAVDADIVSSPTITGG